MGILEIKESPPEVGGMYLEKIYELQKELIDHYVDIEGLPPYPLDINEKESQSLIRDFSSRFIEELAEGYDSYRSCQSFIPNPYVRDGEKDFLIRLLNFNEEQADAMHFLIELLIFSNIQPEDIKKYLEKYNWEGDVEGREDIIDLAMETGYNIINLTLNIRERVCTNDISALVQKSSIEGLKELIFGGREISIKQDAGYFEEISVNVLWHIVYYLNSSRFYLKSKPWKQSEGNKVPESLYQEALVQTFILYMGYLKFVGISSKGIYTLYFKKNRVNHQRIQSNY